MGRIERVDSEIQKELSTLINNQLKDPRIDANVCILRVETTKDLKHCKVYISSFESKDMKNLMKGLKASSVYLRKQLFDTLKIRAVPELQFIIDEGIEHGFRIAKILEELKEKKD